MTSTFFIDRNLSSNYKHVPIVQDSFIRKVSAAIPLIGIGVETWSNYWVKNELISASSSLAKERCEYLTKVMHEFKKCAQVRKIITIAVLITLIALSLVPASVTLACGLFIAFCAYRIKIDYDWMQNSQTFMDKVKNPQNYNIDVENNKFIVTHNLD